MKTSQFPKKFLSLRDKSGSHRRSKSSEPGQKNRPLQTDSLFALFKPDAARQPRDGDDEKEKEAAKIEEVAQLLAEANIIGVTTEHIRDTINSHFAAGNVQRAVELIQMQQKASAGRICSYNPQIEMVGAENRGNVTCYLDALLFAMFARLDAYERMLGNDFASDEPRRRLVVLLRLWVNMLRSGKLIHTDMTKLIQDALADCGWKDARLLEQQDTSEAFAFITETLELPLLQLQVDLFHQGQNDKDDHKLVYERLLNLAVPPDPDGKGIQLEDCLEEYFNTQVDVLRDSYEEKKKENEIPSLTVKSTIRLVTEGDDQESEGADQLQLSPLPMSPALERRWTHAAGADGDTGDSSPGPSRPTPRHRSTSVIQRVLVGEDGRPNSTDASSMPEKSQRKTSTMVKAVTIPAWQFFRLIPWNMAGTPKPRNDMEVALSFDQRPVVGICLKRYIMTNSGVPQRHNTFIDIPDSLRLPRFMVDEKQIQEDPNGFNTEYKLVLQSVVCHRGDSLQSGHYIAFARVAPKLLTDNRRHDADPPPDYEEAQWVKFDDLQLESRVKYVDDIKQSLKEEMPYLLFYQIVPMVEVASTEDTETEPPSYNESKVSINLSTTSDATNDNNQAADLSRSTDYFDTAELGRLPKAPSIRFSAELERPSRLSFGDDDQYAFMSRDSRRGSLSVTDSTLGTPAITPETTSPAITPGEESTAQRLSRAAARFASKSGSKSRPTSQAGEGRISLTMSRLGLTRTSKEPLRDGNGLVTMTSAPILPTSSTVEEIEEVASDRAGHGAEVDANTSHRHGHKRGKSKNRSVDKSKHKEHRLGVPPERECSIM